MKWLRRKKDRKQNQPNTFDESFNALLLAFDQLKVSNEKLQASFRKAVDANAKLNNVLSTYAAIFVAVSEATRKVLDEEEMPEDLRAKLDVILNMMQAGKFDTLH